MQAGGWRLRPVQAQEGVEEVEIRDRPLTLGRDPDCEVVVPADRFPHVSGRHARILPGEPGPRVEDLGSTNGTLVNGRRVETAPLSSGSVVQLGELGPSFVVLSPTGLEQTAMIPAGAVRSERRLGQTAILSLKEALGVGRESDVGEMVARSRRRTIRIVGTALVAIALGLAGFLWWAEDRDRREIGDLRAQNESLRQSLQAQLDENRDLAAELAAELARAGAEARTDRERFQSFLSETRAERDRLADRFERLEAEGSASAGERAALRAELDETGARLALFDPVNLAEAELSEVGRVRSAVVLIEVELTWREAQTGEVLYIDPDDDEGGFFNLEGRGQRFAQGSTGSGFCVTDQGWIVTNAHVAEPEDSVELRIGADVVLEPHVAIHVVFSDEERRHAASVVAVAEGPGDDLALLSIEPFEGMPHLEGLDLDVPPMPLGSEVYLFGFPLGTQALQEGDRVIASTFKGIVSRDVEPFFQVDAAVHPGNSGGPVTDHRGRVVGIVTASQRLPDDQIAYTIGYAIPIARLAAIWPPGE